MNKNLSMVLGCILSLKPTAYISLFYRFIAIIFMPLDLFLYVVENLYFLEALLSAAVALSVSLRAIRLMA